MMDYKGRIKTREYHLSEAKRIGMELHSLGCEFAEDGIVRTVLRARIAAEEELAEVVQNDS
jgi:hypothetical protein